MASINRQQLVEQLSQEILKSLVVPIKKLVREELEIEHDIIRRGVARDVKKLVEQQLINDRKLIKGFVQKLVISEVKKVNIRIPQQKQRSNSILTESFEDDFLSEEQQPLQQEERHYSDDSEVDRILRGTDINSNGDAAMILGPEMMREVQSSPAFRQAVQIQTNRSQNAAQQVQTKKFNFDFMNEYLEKMEESAQEMRHNSMGGAASLLMEHSEGAVRSMDQLYDPAQNKTEARDIIRPGI